MPNENEPNDELLDEAMAHKDTIPSEPPKGNETWLEQFRLFGQEDLERLDSVASLGLEALEAETLIGAAAKLVRIAAQHDPDALDKLINLVAPDPDSN